VSHRYRTIPEVVEAEKWVKGLSETSAFMRSACCFDEHRIGREFFGAPHIHNADGIRRITEGDWIVKDAQGEVRPLKQVSFSAMYEVV